MHVRLHRHRDADAIEPGHQPTFVRVHRRAGVRDDFRVAARLQRGADIDVAASFDGEQIAAIPFIQRRIDSVWRIAFDPLTKSRISARERSAAVRICRIRILRGQVDCIDCRHCHLVHQV